MILNLIFGFLVVCFIWGLLKSSIETILSYVLGIAITALMCAVIGWLIGFWYVGAIAGAAYALFCMLFRKQNKLLSWWFARY